MVSIKVNQFILFVKKNVNVFQACKIHGFFLPHFCFHERLSVAGNCRLCLVEIKGMPKPVASCAFPVSEGLDIYIESPLVKKAQASVMEFLLVNHPLDCPICDQGGECDLQEYSKYFGNDRSRFFFKKRTVSKKIFGMFVYGIITRCIHCTRCVRFFKEISGENVIGIIGRSSQSEISSYTLKSFQQGYIAGNVVDLCPVGYLFYSHKLKMLFFKILLIIVPLLVAIAFFTVLERKLMGAIQRRLGPNVVGFFGLTQALADGLKLFTKESILPSSANHGLFIISPLLTFTLSLVSWAVIPFHFGSVLSDIHLGLLYLFAVSSLGVYGIILAGWSSNSKYAFLGALRSAAQIISYEISISFILSTVILFTGSFNLTTIVEKQQSIWYVVAMAPIGVMFFISVLAETNRHPFDLPEAEAELVSGYNVEYSGMGFALFFLGEYGNIILISLLTVLLFFGGWSSSFPYLGTVFFALKTLFFIFLFIWARAAYPRYRYDQLMRIGWKVFLPISIGWVFFIAGVLLSFNWLP